jgi:hypothetical protein
MVWWVMVHRGCRSMVSHGRADKKIKFGTAEPIADCKRLKVNSQPNLLCIQSYDHRSQEKGLPAS